MLKKVHFVPNFWFLHLGIFCTLSGNLDSAYEKKALNQNFHTLSTKTTMGQLFGIILDIWSWL